MNSSGCDEDGDAYRERERMMMMKNKVAIRVAAEENGRSLILMD